MISIPFHCLLVRGGALLGTFVLLYLTQWWFPIVFAVLYMLVRGWYEQVLVGVVLDVLYASFSTSSSILGPFTASSCLVAFCVWYLRTRVRSVAY